MPQLDHTVKMRQLDHTVSRKKTYATPFFTRSCKKNTVKTTVKNRRPEMNKKRNGVLIQKKMMSFSGHQESLVLQSNIFLAHLVFNLESKETNPEASSI
jgi:hypothetical protein